MGPGSTQSAAPTEIDSSSEEAMDETDETLASAVDQAGTFNRTNEWALSHSCPSNAAVATLH